ncbi:transcriptional regulator [Aeromonas sp. A5]|uniref:winged helix-turn-helix domain-containing protein n=1 Tax=unclassified Aeromonas TaxID=257493 RepID=UPI0037700C75
MIGNIEISISSLSSSEVLIIDALSRSYPTAISRSDLLSIAWPNKVVSETSLNVAINNIRANLSCQIGEGKDILLTERGFGYRLTEDPISQKILNVDIPEHVDKYAMTESMRINIVKVLYALIFKKIVLVKGKQVNIIPLLIFLIINITLFIIIVFILSLYIEGASL